MKEQEAELLHPQEAGAGWAKTKQATVLFRACSTLSTAVQWILIITAFTSGSYCSRITMSSARLLPKKSATTSTRAISSASVTYTRRSKSFSHRRTQKEYLILVIQINCSKFMITWMRPSRSFWRTIWSLIRSSRMLTERKEFKAQSFKNCNHQIKTNLWWLTSRRMLLK